MHYYKKINLNNETKSAKIDFTLKNLEQEMIKRKVDLNQLQQKYKSECNTNDE